MYADHVASALRTLSLTESKSFVLNKLSGQVGLKKGAIVVRDFLNGKIFQGAVPNVLYGYHESSFQTRRWQVRSFLSDQSLQFGPSKVIFFPNEVDVKGLADHVKKSNGINYQGIQVGDAMPASAAPNTIYLVELGSLAHPIFVGLVNIAMKSGSVPVGGGDGFLSAAIELGKPFVSISVDWNHDNLEQIAKHLEQFENRKNKNSKDTSILPIDNAFRKKNLIESQALVSLSDAFESLRDVVGNLTTNLIDLALSAAIITPTPPVPKKYFSPPRVDIDSSYFSQGIPRALVSSSPDNELSSQLGNFDSVASFENYLNSTGSYTIQSGEYSYRMLAYLYSQLIHIDQFHIEETKFFLTHSKLFEHRDLLKSFLFGDQYLDQFLSEMVSHDIDPSRMVELARDSVSAGGLTALFRACLWTKLEIRPEVLSNLITASADETPAEILGGYFSSLLDLKLGNHRKSTIQFIIDRLDPEQISGLVSISSEPGSELNLEPWILSSLLDRTDSAVIKLNSKNKARVERSTPTVKVDSRDAQNVCQGAFL